MNIQLFRYVGLLGPEDKGLTIPRNFDTNIAIGKA
jgi:hypothetical protein